MAYGDWAQFKRRSWERGKGFHAVLEVDGGSQEDWDEWFGRHAEHFTRAVHQPISITKREAVEREASR